MRSPEEERMIKDVDYDHIGEQLGISVWIWAFMTGGILIFLLALAYWVFKCMR